MNNVKQHCCPRLSRVPPVAEAAWAQSPRSCPGTWQHQGQVGVSHHGATGDSDHSDGVAPGENEALSILVFKA